MHPILARIGPFTVYSYGVMVALGFGMAAFLMHRRAASSGIDQNKILDIAILVLIGGVIGARVFYISLNLDYYLKNPLETWNLSKGGLVWYGAFITGLIISAWYLKKHGIAFWAFADLAGPYAALAQSLGRIGCFLNGCCFGKAAPAGFPFAVSFPGSAIFRHPAQVYSSILLLIIFVILIIAYDSRHFKGEIFLAYCMLYSSKRFLLESLRGDNPAAAFGLTVSQVISIAFFLGSLSIFAYKDYRWRVSASR